MDKRFEQALHQRKDMDGRSWKKMLNIISYLKMCVKTKTKVTYHYTPIRMAKIEKTQD